MKKYSSGAFLVYFLHFITAFFYLSNCCFCANIIPNMTHVLKGQKNLFGFSRLGWTNHLGIWIRITVFVLVKAFFKVSLLIFFEKLPVVGHNAPPGNRVWRQAKLRKWFYEGFKNRYVEEHIWVRASSNIINLQLNNSKIIEIQAQLAPGVF